MPGHGMRMGRRALALCLFLWLVGALTVYNYVEETKKTGAPVDWFVISEGVAIPTGSGVSPRAPHPHAALLFYNFMLINAQPILAGREFLMTSKDIKSPLREIPL